MICSKKTILLDSQTLTATGSGSAFALSKSAKQWVAEISVAGSVTNGSGSLTPKIQSSFDGTHWSDEVSFTAITATNAYETKLSSSSDYTKPLAPYFRVAYTITGTTPSYSGVTVNLYTDA